MLILAAPLAQCEWKPSQLSCVAFSTTSVPFQITSLWHIGDCSSYWRMVAVQWCRLPMPHCTKPVGNTGREAPAPFYFSQYARPIFRMFRRKALNLLTRPDENSFNTWSCLLQNTSIIYTDTSINAESKLEQLIMVGLGMETILSHSQSTRNICKTSASV